MELLKQGAIYKDYSQENENSYGSIEKLINLNHHYYHMPTTNYVLGNLEEVMRKECEVYRVALQTDLRTALCEQHWEGENMKVNSLRGINEHYQLADSFFPVRDEFVYRTMGYIFPFRRTAIADTAPFIHAFAQVLLPQGYEVLRYAHHRGLPDIRSLVELVKHNNSPQFQVVRNSEQLFV